ncbi:hypothetical protein [Eubacterium xylanophilum]|uniref:hypothetical protein n=1 Tax=Eubacterium xylanophilum TaxID=39497 RepID=UPI00047C59F7|nr:hypothetical protein [Eubacterium xylanophilum]MCR5797331.1 hypothetical protein [Eubacterium sp.]
MREAKKTLIRVNLIIWVIGGVTAIVGLILAIWLSINLLSYILGDVLGCACSSVLMLHRYMTLDAELDMAKKTAKNHLKVMATLRTVFMLFVLFLGFYKPDIFWPVTVFVGLFSTKIAALIYPFIFRESSAVDATDSLDAGDGEKK